MAIIKNLSVAISPADQTAIMTALDTALTTLNGVQIVTLSPKERQETPGVQEGRAAYVINAINVLGPSYPDLVGKAVSTASAADALSSFGFLEEMITKLAEINDRAADLGLNLQNTAYNYTTDLYYTAERYVDDVPGADIVVQEIAPLFAEQGNHNPAPATP